MKSIVENAIQADVHLHNPSPRLWNVDDAQPAIRQIYGHFLPPPPTVFNGA